MRLRLTAPAVLAIAVLLGAGSAAAGPVVGPSVQNATALAAILQGKGFGCNDLAVGLPTFPHHPPPRVVTRGHGPCSITNPQGDSAELFVFANAGQLKRQLGAVKGLSCAEAKILGESSDELISGPNWVIRYDGSPAAARALAAAIPGTDKTITCTSH
jgi:hypothetical protein